MLHYIPRDDKQIIMYYNVLIRFDGYRHYSYLYLYV